MAEVDNDEIQMIREALRAIPESHPKRPLLLIYFSNRLGDRYATTKSTTDLEDAIRISLQVVDTIAENHPDRPGVLGNIGNLLGDRYLRSGAISDVEKSIQVTREALTLVPDGHPNRAALLTNLGNRLGDRFLQTGSMADLEQAVQAGRDAVVLSTEHHPHYARLLYNLAVRLVTQYSRTHAMVDLEEAIQLGRQAVHLTPKDDKDRSEVLMNLGNFLSKRYSVTGSIHDLQESIQLETEAVNATPEGHPQQADYITNLGAELATLYSRTGLLSDLEEAIRMGQKAVDLAHEGHPHRAAVLHNLGTHLTQSYLRTGSMTCLEEAIRLRREAVRMTPDKHPDGPVRLDGLGLTLGFRYSRTGAEIDLEEAIRVGWEAVNGSPENQPGRAEYLNNLGARLGDRYAQAGTESDLKEAIRLCREAVNTTPTGQLGRAGRLNNLAIFLGYEYSKTGAVSDLGEAIRAAQEAVDATPEPETHISRPIFLATLVGLFGDRFLRTGAMPDLEEAIRVGREAFRSMPKDHPDRVSLLNNLGLQLGDRYARTGADGDLDESIELIRESVKMTPERHISRAKRLNNLQIRLGDRFLATGAEVDLKEAIRVGREAIDGTPEGHPNRALFLSNLGNRLGDVFERTGDMVDLNEAIRICQEAINAMPKTHSRRAELSINLGNRLSDRYRKTGAISDFEAVTAEYQAALCHSSSVASTRITAGRKLLWCYADKLRWQQAYDASTIAVPLIPELTIRSLENSDKQHLLGEVVGLASDAAAAALHAGRGSLVALNFLEQGRGVLGTSLEELRTDVLALKEKHPELAEHFIRLREELETRPISHVALNENHQAAAWQAQSHRRYKAGDDLDKLINSIRQKPHFDDFLLAPSQAEMMGAASCGPIIVINVSEFRCDAILIQQQGIQSVSLTRLNRQEIEEKSQKGLGSPEILEWLWDAIADPVLSALGFTDPPQGNLPHVWWIPTGPLAKFPIHAAGYHMKGQAVIDRAMSSYSSSVKAIIHTRRRPTTPSTSAHALLVAMEHTPGSAIRLPFAPKEIGVLHNLCKSMKLHPIEPGRRKEDVISHLPQCKIFHFAGHGYTNGADPSKSHLLLQDEPLTVANLLEIDLRKHSPFLAYLSACGTGRVKDERFVDESIHLISGCQLAGFRHVIGTLWEVNDESCVEMAKLTYEGIRNGGLTDESVCQGLHAACRELRDQWLATRTDAVDARMMMESLSTEDGADVQGSSERHSGEARIPRDFILCDDLDGATTLHWVPYVHFGV